MPTLDWERSGRSRAAEGVRGGGKLKSLRAQLTATDATNAGDGKPPPRRARDGPETGPRRARDDRIYFLFSGTCPHSLPLAQDKKPHRPPGGPSLPSTMRCITQVGAGASHSVALVGTDSPPPLPPGPPPAGPSPSPGPGPGPGPAPQPYPPPRFAAGGPAGRDSAGGGQEEQADTPHR